MNDQPRLPFTNTRRPSPQGDCSSRPSEPSLDTRAEAIIIHELEGKVGEQAQRILDALISQGPMSINQLERYFAHNATEENPLITKSAICGRLKELRQSGKTEKLEDKRKDEITGLRNEVIRAVDDFIIADSETKITTIDQ